MGNYKWDISLHMSPFTYFLFRLLLTFSALYFPRAAPQCHHAICSVSSSDLRFIVWWCVLSYLLTPFCHYCTHYHRFPGFMAVCSPLLASWNLPDATSVNAACRFYSDALEKINRLGLSEFTTPDGPVNKETISIPKMKPHWLAELCTDICLSATGHAEESIQFRASALLFELFWSHSQRGRYEGKTSVVASIFLPFVPKILSHLDYLSSLPAKGQLRKDILPCALFVLQSAPVGKSLWIVHDS